MLELLQLFTSGQFIPDEHCYLWKPELVTLNIISDSLIALAYYSIAIMLVYFVHERRDVPFQGIFLLFGAFIIACGSTHLMEVWTLWHPTYWLNGSLKLITATISLYTASKLFPLIPQALILPSPAQLEAANQKLAQEINERQQVEAALRNSEALFRSIFEGAGIGISVVDMAGKVVAVNPALQRMLGYAQDKLSAMSFKEYTHPENVPSGWERYQELIVGQRDYYQLEKRYPDKDGQLWDRDYYQMEKRYLGKDGQLLWCHITISLVRDAQGKPQFGIRMVEDITERKRTEAALRQHQQRLEELVGKRTLELTQANEKLSWQASHDALTGLVNRREFERRLEEAVTSANMQNQNHTLCYLDLDRFKIVNDTCGHIAGDELLRQITALMKSKCRQSDVLARLGGDEFGLLLYQCSKEQALRVTESLRQSIEAFRFVWQDKCLSIGVSIGLVAINVKHQNLSYVLSAADTACYAAKNKGRNRVYCLPD